MIAAWRQVPARLAALLTLTAAVPAAAQLTDAGTPVRPPGWSVTPAVGARPGSQGAPKAVSPAQAR